MNGWVEEILSEYVGAFYVPLDFGLGDILLGGSIVYAKRKLLRRSRSSVIRYTFENLKRRVWQCNRKYEKKGEVRCKNKHIDGEVLFKAFVSSFNALVENKEQFIEKWKDEDGMS